MNRKLSRLLKRQFSADSLEELQAEDISVESLSQTFKKLGVLFEDYDEKLTRAHNSLDISTKEQEIILSQIKDINIIQKLILENIDKGFLAINKEGKCLAAYSPCCKKLFQSEKIEDKFIWDLLQVKDITVFRQWFDTLFKPGMPIDSLLEIGPSTFDKNPGRTINLSFKPMFKEEKLIAIVLFAKDITEILHEKKLAEELHSKSQRITNIFTSMNDYKNFIEFYGEMIKKIESPNKDMTYCYEIEQDLHSVKGLSGYFFFTNLSFEINKYEGLMKKIDQKNLPTDQTFFQHLLRDLTAAFRKDQKPIEVITKQMGIGKDRTTIDIDILDSHLFKLIDQPKIVESFYKNVICQNISQSFTAFTQETQRLADSLQKEVAPIKLKNDIKIPPGLYDKFIQTLIHVFRNIMDHGIERPEIRRNLGKTPEGNIIIDTQKIRDQIMIKIHDDGGGIDPQLIREKFKSKGLNEKVNNKSDYEVLQTIFTSRFSTLKEVTSLSGMGIGASAVKSEVVKLGGSITVDSEVGKFTEFTILLPYFNHKDYIKSKSAKKTLKAA